MVFLLLTFPLARFYGSGSTLLRAIDKEDPAKTHEYNKVSKLFHCQPERQTGSPENTESKGEKREEGTILSFLSLLDSPFRGLEIRVQGRGRVDLPFVADPSNHSNASRSLGNAPSVGGYWAENPSELVKSST